MDVVARETGDGVLTLNARIVPLGDASVEDAEDGAARENELRDTGDVEDDGDGVSKKREASEVVVTIFVASEPRRKRDVETVGKSETLT